MLRIVLTDAIVGEQDPVRAEYLRQAVAKLAPFASVATDGDPITLLRMLSTRVEALGLEGARLLLTQVETPNSIGAWRFADLGASFVKLMLDARTSLQRSAHLVEDAKRRREYQEAKREGEPTII